MRQVKVETDTSWHKLTPNEVYFTSDTHFGHKNILKYSERTRPYASVEEMDAALVDNWNKRVKPDDLVFHLGDFAFHRKEDVLINIFRQLNGKIVLVLGNHDELVRQHADALLALNVHSIHSYIDAKIDGQHIAMCHYPLASWNRAHHGAWNLHGHCHGTYPPVGLQLDVGSDSYVFDDGKGCELLSFEEVRAYMGARQIVTVDGHKSRIK